MGEYNIITYDQIIHNDTINTYIEMANESLKAMGFTEHSHTHINNVVENVEYILKTMGYSDRQIELGKIAAYMHDIGNVVNRVNHSQSGAIMAYRILTDLNMDPVEIAMIVSAIGNHDEGSGKPVSPIAAALILADKSDVRRSRVQNENGLASFDIHDRVNYSVTKSELKINQAHTIIKLKLTVDTHFSSVMDYFEIFMVRMNLCRLSAEKLGLQFKLMINEQSLV